MRSYTSMPPWPMASSLESAWTPVTGMCRNRMSKTRTLQAWNRPLARTGSTRFPTKAPGCVPATWSGSLLSRRHLLFEQIPDLGQQLFLSRRFGGRLFGLSMHFIRRLNDEEKHESHDEEVDDGGEKRPVVQRHGFIRCGLGRGPINRARSLAFLEHKEHVVEVGPAQQADDRIDDVLDQGGHDPGERCADDDADGQVEHVSLGDELTKLLKHGSPPRLRGATVF